MKAIILAGGYAKRLWPLTKDTPKPLLDVGGQEIISRIIDKTDNLDEINEIVISTNAKFEEKFRQYISKKKVRKQTQLVVEPTMDEGQKLGSIGGLNFLIDHLQIDEDVLIIGGDNIFEFSIQKFVDYYADKNSSSIALKMLDDPELLKKYGTCVLDENCLITDFHEKSSAPKSNLVSTACYIFTFSDLMLVKKYLNEGNSADAMGFFVTWLIRNADVYGFVFTDAWFDIGSFESLDEARKIYGK